MAIEPETFISPSTCAMISMKSPSSASTIAWPVPAVIGSLEPASMTFVVLYSKVGFVEARMPIWPSHLAGSRIASNLEKGSEKRTEFARSGAFSFVCTRVKPQGANCCVAFES